jgi:hypothetical protein
MIQNDKVIIIMPFKASILVSFLSSSSSPSHTYERERESLPSLVRILCITMLKIEGERERDEGEKR